MTTFFAHIFDVFVNSERSNDNQTLRVLSYDKNLEFPVRYGMFNRDLDESLIKNGTQQNLKKYDIETLISYSEVS